MINLLFLLAFMLPGLILLLLADRIAVIQVWFQFTLFGWLQDWIWGENDPFGGKEGTRVFARWVYRLFGLAWLTFPVWARYA